MGAVMDNPAERSKQVQTMFSRITRRYDLMNKVMSAGQDQAWRRAAAAELRLGPNALVVDLATGTGDLAFAVRGRHPDARVMAFDFSETILREGQSVGYLSSAGYGYTLGRPVGMGYLRRAQGVDDAWAHSGRYELVVAQHRRACRMSFAPLYDVKGARVRA